MPLAPYGLSQPSIRDTCAWRLVPTLFLTIEELSAMIQIVLILYYYDLLRFSHWPIIEARDWRLASPQIGPFRAYVPHICSKGIVLSRGQQRKWRTFTSHLSSLDKVHPATRGIATKSQTILLIYCCYCCCHYQVQEPMGSGHCHEHTPLPTALRNCLIRIETWI